MCFCVLCSSNMLGGCGLVIMKRGHLSICHVTIVTSVANRIAYGMNIEHCNKIGEIF